MCGNIGKLSFAFKYIFDFYMYNIERFLQHVCEYSLMD